MDTLNYTVNNQTVPITIGENSIDTLNLKNTLIITDDNIPKDKLTLLQTKLNPIDTIILKHGETAKSLDNYSQIIKTMLLRNCDKTTTIIALGGGVIGDLAGFVASTYQRGINYIHIPTTLLAMVDSSIGGKVAINMHQTKNPVGSFYHPKQIIIDPTFLKTLPKRQFNNGFAEIIKIAVMQDKALFTQLLEDNLDLTTIIKQAIALKINIIEQDPNDLHLRHILNYGHTIAHAIEAHNKNYLHGEAVAIGMAIMAKNTSVYDPLLKALNKYDLPTTITNSMDPLIHTITNDKKRTQRNITIAYTKTIGSGDLKTIPLSKFIQFIQSNDTLIY